MGKNTQDAIFFWILLFCSLFLTTAAALGFSKNTPSTAPTPMSGNIPTTAQTTQTAETGTTAVMTVTVPLSSSPETANTVTATPTTSTQDPPALPPDHTSSDHTSSDPPHTQPQTPPVPPTLPQTPTPMVAAYIATVFRLDFPKSTLATKEALLSEISEIVRIAKKNGINTLIFQVRPASDALYVSKLFPTSRHFVKNEGDPLPLDPLAELIKAAHDDGIAVHAWINPYRITSPNESLSKLSGQNPAKLHPEYTFSSGGAYYYQPADLRVQTLIVEGVKEIVQNYDVDGILFDDYFYPETIENEDAALYAAYKSDGGTLSLGDFRREAVNTLIRKTYHAIKEIDADCLFGVSPRGIWRNAADDPKGSNTNGGAAFDRVYCDALAWVREKTVDYLSPQIYWSFSQKGAEFDILADWWNNALAGSGVAFIPSLAAYRLPQDELIAQQRYISSMTTYGGYMLYRFENLK